jgi:hypothetical protein
VPDTHPTCIIPRCGRIASCRGLCSACYRRAFLKVSFRQETWDSLRAAGLALESKPAGRPAGITRSPFAAAYDGLLARRWADAGGSGSPPAAPEN